MTFQSQPISGAVVGSEPSAAFTPGPWVVETAPTAGVTVRAATNGELVAEAWQTRHGRHDANARLIAAAPELLEALKEAVDLIVHITRSRWSEWEETEDETVGEFRAAIAKASLTPPAPHSDEAGS